MKLPKLEDNERWKSIEKLKLPSVDILEIDEQKEKFKKHFEIECEKVELKENVPVVESYKNLVDLFRKKNVDKDELFEVYQSEMKSLGLSCLEDFEVAIENGNLDLSRYDIYTLTQVFNHLENNKKVKNLEDYGMITIGDFYTLVTSGKLDVSKYEEKEIDLLLEKLLKE